MEARQKKVPAQDLQQIADGLTEEKSKAALSRLNQLSLCC